MKTHVTCICSFILLVLFSCGGEGNVDSLSQNDLADPQKVAEAFYNAVNKAEYDAAKKFCKIELGDKLDLYKDFKTVEESKPYEFLETINKKDQYATGDTVTVKYRVGKVKSDFQMVYDTDKFTIISGKTLQIRKIQVKSIDLHNYQIGGKTFDKNSEYLLKELSKLDGFRFEISDALVYLESNNKGYGFFYDKASNSIPHPKCFEEPTEFTKFRRLGYIETGGDTICLEFYIGESIINSSLDNVQKTYVQGNARHMTFEFVDSDESMKIGSAKSILSNCNEINCTKLKFQKLSNIEAVLVFSGDNNDYLVGTEFYFKNAVVSN